MNRFEYLIALILFDPRRLIVLVAGLAVLAVAAREIIRFMLRAAGYCPDPQKYVLIAAMAICVAMALYPRWILIDEVEEEQTTSIKCASIFFDSNPYDLWGRHDQEIDMIRLLLQWAAVWLVAGGIWLWLERGKLKRLRNARISPFTTQPEQEKDSLF